MSLAAEDADSFGSFVKPVQGGKYTLMSHVSRLLQEDMLPGLKQLLDIKADPDASFDAQRSRESSKRLKAVYKKILDKTDVVICTPVVASKLASHDLFKPIVIIFDEAGMLCGYDTSFPH